MALTTRRATIESRIRQLESELAELSKYGEDLFPNGTVLRFKYRFQSNRGPTQLWTRTNSLDSPSWVLDDFTRPSSHWYTYAALKVRGGWYLTGKDGRHSWDQFVDFLSRGEVKKLKMVAQWDEVAE